ncbi:hypothetical protein LPTSP4_20000 [Leptospira ryugenii]|uniref:Phosphoesterase n=1 Tax=Leptospira ryugenii TaxID=1917863 RepID=A0A2P2E0Q6_9LEPT|nr:phosphoesterase [Leptospira ryugenii]GBF50475.1 hypothetical protein LPTSP4_20000 [Leptospira ryugenii]
MFLQEAKIQKEKVFQSIYKKRRWVLLSFVVPMFAMQVAIFQGFAIAFLREPLPALKPFSGAHLHNPYGQDDWSLGQEKVALHLHSSEVWYTPERHSRQDIEFAYSSQGYTALGFTDYSEFFSTKNPKLGSVSGYEWGLNVRKRHALAFGGRESIPDYFPIYASRENVSWTFRKMREAGSYVVVSHPKLHDAYTREDLSKIYHYNAIEVFSPFGDDTKVLDHLLSQGRNVHCMSSDDMHYLPESVTKTLDQPWWKSLLQTVLLQRGRKGEGFKRHLVFPKTHTNETNIHTDLEAGAFFCVKKHFADATDPLVPQIKIEGSEITLTSEERYIEVRWIGENGEYLKIDSDTNKSKLALENVKTYVRLELMSLSGVVLSNALTRTNL